MKRVGRRFFALDYNEIVTVIAIERRGQRYTIQRPNGARTYNYPAYLLRRVPA